MLCILVFYKVLLDFLKIIVGFYPPPPSLFSVPTALCAFPCLVCKTNIHRIKAKNKLYSFRFHWQLQCFCLLFKQYCVQDYMKKYCGKTCNFCSSDTPAPCFDDDNECKTLACQGACEQGDGNYVIIFKSFYFVIIFGNLFYSCKVQK